MHRSLIVLLALLGCDPPPPEAPYPVTFESVSDPGVPLAGVVVRAGGREVGATDASGLLTLELQGAEGSSVAIEAVCPTGHRAPSGIAPLVLRRTTDLTTGGAATLRVSVTCAPELRRSVVVLRAGGTGVREGIPVLVDGVEMARTDRSGVAHVALERAPGTTVSVMLATSTVLPEVTPRDPAMPFTFHDADEMFLFDRPLESPPPLAVRPPRPHGPHHTTEETHGPPINLGHTR